LSLPYSTSANLPYGSRVLTINSIAYIANNFRVSQAGKLLERMTELGAPNGAVLIDTPYTGSAELQLANTSIAFPNVSLTFSARVDSENANLNFFITEVGVPETSDQWKNCDITFREVA
jgi:hypothetical protein